MDAGRKSPQSHPTHLYCLISMLRKKIDKDGKRQARPLKFGLACIPDPIPLWVRI
jgi:hypothetical protein